MSASFRRCRQLGPRRSPGTFRKDIEKIISDISLDDNLIITSDTATACKLAREELGSHFEINPESTEALYHGHSLLLSPRCFRQDNPLLHLRLLLLCLHHPLAPPFLSLLLLLSHPPFPLHS